MQHACSPRHQHSQIIQENAESISQAVAAMLGLSCHINLLRHSNAKAHRPQLSLTQWRSLRRLRLLVLLPLLHQVPRQHTRS